MNELFQKNKKIIIFLVIFVGIFIIYTVFIKKPEDTALTVEKAPEALQASIDNKELLEQVQSLNNITLKSEILKSTSFNSLQDNTVVIENRKPEGRKNPFLPIGIDTGSFTPDGTILNATINTNGLLNQNGATNVQSINLSPSNIKSATALEAPKNTPAQSATTTINR
ncbi:MAG: hypothetical protein RI996_620 [Candidatus Parcubacteria bacterium]|jgi:hypothetical protein